MLFEVLGAPRTRAVAACVVRGVPRVARASQGSSVIYHI